MLAPRIAAHRHRTHIPAISQQLTANLIALGNNRCENDEDKLDTYRLQTALDHCPECKAFEPAAQGPNNAFLASPLTPATSITLLIDRDVTLVASRGCSLVNNEPTGCRPLIAVRNAAHAAVIGSGVEHMSVVSNHFYAGHGMSIGYADAAMHSVSIQPTQGPPIITKEGAKINH